MNTCKLTNEEISRAVEGALLSKSWSVIDCCNAYNKLFSMEISGNTALVMKKDFVHRVKKNQFSVLSKRVVTLCDFLDIDLNVSKTSSFDLKDEMEKIEQVIRKNPMIEIKIKNLLRNVAEIAGATQ